MAMQVNDVLTKHKLNIRVLTYVKHEVLPWWFLH
jgi:hypothetical protein